MSCKDRLPSPPRRRIWRDGEQRTVVGDCLRTAFAPEADAEMTALLARMDDTDRKRGSR